MLSPTWAKFLFVAMGLSGLGGMIGIVAGQFGTSVKVKGPCDDWKNEKIKTVPWCIGVVEEVKTK